MAGRVECASCARERVYRLGTRTDRSDYRIALAGNPNTGKSTLFNRLTGLNQRTGNWPGKTVSSMEGAFRYGGRKYRRVDLPGTYSLLSTSEDEEIARNYILFGSPDVTVVVADASRLERNLNLVLQIASITPRCVLCVNLLDEARRNRVEVDLPRLSHELGVPVVGTSAASGEGLAELLETIARVAEWSGAGLASRALALPRREGEALGTVTTLLQRLFPSLPSPEWVAMRLLDGDMSVEEYMRGHAGQFSQEVGLGGVADPYAQLMATVAPLRGVVGGALQSAMTQSFYGEARAICAKCVREGYQHGRSPVDRRIDRLLTSRVLGFPIMLLMLAGVLWFTILGANVPSSLLDDLLVQWLHPQLKHFGEWVGMPWWLSGFLIDGVYLATAWVVAVMLPPMAIFFPLFTLLEDFGYLPRVAFNLDELFRRSGAHGKQALTMAMGFGCNAAGIVATRIIDSPRERLIAILTNNFSLCNGRWPTQIMVATLFVGAAVPAAWRGAVSVLAVVGIAVLGIVLTFGVSWLLSRTLLRGQVSTFHLELPPYRRPQVLRVLYTSLIDRTLKVLWRAIVFAAPAGALIWLTCNLHVGGGPIAHHLIGWLDGPGGLMGLNGVILLAYVLAIPANEIVLPTILMLIVLATGMEGVGAGAGVLFESEVGLSDLLAANGWTTLTGVSLMLFCLLHNPCSTAIYTIYKETKSVRWTLVGALLPVVLGVAVCICVAAVWRAVDALV